MRISAIIAAAGKGTRIESQLPKQYMEINSKPILAYTLDIFEKCAIIDEIIIVAREIEYLGKHITGKYDYKKAKVVHGGETRQDSVYAGLLAVSETTDIVLVHDGARPFVTDAEIRSVADAAKLYGCCSLGVRVKDTIKICGEDNRILQTPDREALWAMQTPQGFERTLIMHAHESARLDGYVGTDDVALAERLGYSPYVVRGSYENIKITTADDLAYAEWLVSRRAIHKSTVQIERFV